MYRKKNSEWLKHLDFEILDIIYLEILVVFSYFGAKMVTSMILE